MSSIDYRGIPTSACPNCQCVQIKTWVVIDPDTYDIVMYGTEGSCLECETKITLGTPPDHPYYVQEEIEQEIDEYNEEGYDEDDDN